MWTKIHYFLIMFIAPMAISFKTDVRRDSYSGYAYKEGTHDLVYTEEFTDKFVNGKQMETLTNYFDPRHKAIAQRKLDFAKSKFAPDFRTEDLRTGYTEGAEVNGAKVMLFVKKDKNSPLQKKVIDVPEPVVIDGGFNQFIKANWNDLETGKCVAFNFTVSSRLDYYTLQASKVDITDTELILKIEPHKTVLRWLADPVIIHYDRQTKRILTYEGKSNIADETGSNFITKLIYPDKGP